VVEAMYPGKRLIHLFLDRVWACQLALTKRGLDNARYHHAKLVQAWLARPECRIKLHFVPAYCPHLNPIERLWGSMHKHIAHNRCYERFADFRDAMLTFLRQEMPYRPTSVSSRVGARWKCHPARKVEMTPPGGGHTCAKRRISQTLG
jgi:hypothetical protein